MSKRVAILGGGLGGLSAAIHARLRGYEVTLLEGNRTCGGKAARIRRDGFVLDPGPSILILPRIYRDVFDRAGRRMEDYLQFRRLDPISRVFYQGQVFDLPSDRTACIEAVRKIDVEDANAFAALLNRLDGVVGTIDRTIFRKPILQPWQLADPNLIKFATAFDPRLTYRQQVDKWFRSPLVRAFFYGFPSYGGQTYDSKAPGALLIPYYMIQEGVWYPEGGVAAIPEAFERLARDLGVEIRTEARVTRLECDRHAVQRVHLEDGTSLPVSAVISNVDRTTVEHMLGRTAAPQPSYSYFTLHWGLRTRPTGLAHHTLVIPDGFEQGFESLYQRREFPDPPIVYLNETSATDSSVAPDGMGNLFAVVTSPACEPTLNWEDRKAEFRGKVLTTLRGAGIDVARHDPVFERVQTPRYFQAEHGNYLGSLYGPDEKSRPFAGMFPPTNRDPELRNLTYCGGSVQPGAGLPMVTLSGKFAADLL